MTADEALERAKSVQNLLCSAYDVVTYLLEKEDLGDKDFLMRIGVWRVPVSEALKAVNAVLVDNAVLLAQNKALLERLAREGSDG